MLDEIYSRLMDCQSREIYKSRLLYSLTGDYDEIRKIVAGTKAAQGIRDRLRAFHGNDVFIWGTGFWGRWIVKSFPDMAWKGYVDNNSMGGHIDGFPVYGAEEFFLTYINPVVVIATVFYHKEIYRQLISAGVEERRIINAGQMMNDLFDNQYFDLPYFAHIESEVFVDAGCFDGQTVRNFIKWCGGRYKEIISFEPDEKCYVKCRKALQDVKNLTLKNCGLWNCEDVLRFNATGASDSKIDITGENQIRVAKLDDIVGDREISFIKMDIEGAEKNAILGAKNVIKSQKPKMAVSIYHEKEDIWELPRLLLDINPDYRFYLRHYSLRDAETVLYAV